MNRYLSGSGLAIATLVLAGTVLSPRPARACGGLFCSTSPVDQNAERILFEVHETGYVTATVEISYAGDPDAFSWIVPVPETPSDMDVAPPSALRLLDNVTAPIIISPPTKCSDNWRGSFPVPGPVADSSTAAPEAGDVVVEDLPAVGPYDPEVVSSDDPEALVAWLEENNYLITDEMKPLIASYSENGYKFLGVKLLPDAGVSDISPLTFTCPSPDGAPLIPIQLTAVASEPEMGILTFILGESRFAPMNYQQLTVDTDLVQFNPRDGSSNYYPLVSWLVDQEGGRAFVTELAAQSNTLENNVQSAFLSTSDFEEAQAWVADKLAAHRYTTRMYTRLSGWEMTEDPIFMAMDSGADVSNVHDLSDRPEVEICSPLEVAAVPCGNTYCGDGSRCAITADGQEGCVCDAGTVARAITAPRGRGLPLGRSVTCQDTSIDMLQSALGQIGDPCDGFGCGEGGQCLPVNGFATCECREGFVAVADFVTPNGLDCRPVDQVFAPDQLLWPEGVPGANACSCFSARPTQMASSLGVWMLLMGLMVGAKRRRA
jgi:hypothetical protein